MGSGQFPLPLRKTCISVLDISGFTVTNTDSTLASSVFKWPFIVTSTPTCCLENTQYIYVVPLSVEMMLHTVKALDLTGFTISALTFGLSEELQSPPVCPIMTKTDWQSCPQSLSIHPFVFYIPPPSSLLTSLHPLFPLPCPYHSSFLPSLIPPSSLLTSLHPLFHPSLILTYTLSSSLPSLIPPSSLLTSLHPLFPHSYLHPFILSSFPHPFLFSLVHTSCISCSNVWGAGLYPPPPHGRTHWWPLPDPLHLNPFPQCPVLFP